MMPNLKPFSYACLLILLLGGGALAGSFKGNPSCPESSTLCHNTNSYLSTNAVTQILRNRDNIETAAKLYGVDPVIVGTIFGTEQSLLDGKDKIENIFAKSPAGDISDDYSIGPAQIKLSRARSVERLAAKRESRPIRHDAEILKELLTDRGALLYVSAIVRDAQDIYKQGGFDISTNPAILGTLYNIGDPLKRLQRTLKERHLPEATPYGIFVKQNSGTVGKILFLRETSVSHCIACEAQKVFNPLEPLAPEINSVNKKLK